MKVFQTLGFYSAYNILLSKRYDSDTLFKDMLQKLIDDRYGGVHYLKPVIEGNADCFFAACNNETLQRRWAVENGIASGASLEDILLAQIEHHGAEIFYNGDPVLYGNEFLARLPGCVRRTIAWRAAPSGKAAFLKHDLIVNNYPSLAAKYRAEGAKTAFFFPGHDPAMDDYGANEDRPIDVLFIGGYSRHHLERAGALEAVSRLADRYNVIFNLEISRATRLAESPLGIVGPLRKLRRPSSVRKVAKDALFGRDMYQQISRAKVVINGKVDIAGPDRGNMRVWESLGCGAALVTDEGNYPPGMIANKHFRVYSDTTSLLQQIHDLLQNPTERLAMAARGREMIREEYSKEVQWCAFEALCGHT